MRTLLFSVILMLFSFGEGGAQQAVYQVDNQFKKSNFPANFTVLEDKSFEATPTEAFQKIKEKSHKPPVYRANFGYSRAAFWLSTQISSVASFPKQITISLENPNIDSVEFWINRGYGFELMGSAGDHIPHEQWIKPSRQPSFSLTIFPEQKMDILVRARNNYSGNMILPMRIWDSSYFHWYQTGYHLVWGLYFGFLLINFALACWAVIMLRHILYAWYALFLISSFAYTSLTFGFFYQFISGNWPGSNDLLRTIVVIFLSIFLLRFSQLFLRLKAHFWKLHFLISAIIGVQLAFLVSSLFFFEFFRTNFNAIFPWILTLILSGYLVLFFVSFWLIRKEPLRSKALMSAYGLSLIGGGILILTDLNLLPYNMLSIHAAWLGNSIEIVIFTGFLFYELKLIGEQKIKLEQMVADERQQRMIAFFRGQEKERERIARDLHDHVAGTLVGARFLLPNPLNLRHLLDERTLTGYQRAIQTLDNSIKDVRNLSHDLQPPSLNEKSLKYELQRLISDYNAMQPQVNYHLHYELDDSIIDTDMAVAVYRICQECLQNSFKHANASNIHVHLYNKEHRVHLSFSDDGQGFDTSTQANGIGLQNIQTRLGFANNLVYCLESSPGKGTSIQLAFDGA